MDAELEKGYADMQAGRTKSVKSAFADTGKFVIFSRTGVWAYSIWFYMADILMVLIDLLLCVRNRKPDQRGEQ